MTESVIQTQIKLVGFKAVKVEVNCLSQKTNDNFKPKFDLNLGDLQFEDSPNWFAKVFYVQLDAPSEGTDEFVHYDVEFHAVFECSQPVDGNFLSSEFAKISAPAIGFPYVRAFISTLSLQAGLPPIILPSINFVQFSKADAGQSR